MPQNSGRLLGYARVSTKDQRLRMQLDGLSSAQCDLIFQDHGVSGAKSHRDGLDALLAELRPGDTVVVFKLDRLGRSVLHLADLLVRFQKDGVHFRSLCEGINTATPGGKLVYHLFSAFAEFQRDIIVENTKLGLEAARRKGRVLGRPPRVDIERATMAHRLLHQEQLTISEIARRYGVSRTTLRRALQRVEADHAPR